MSHNHRPSLLLLPFHSHAPSQRSIAESYHQPVSSALSRLKSPTHSAKLTVAVVGPFLRTSTGSDGASKTSVSWSETQGVLSGLYSLIAYLCAQQSIATDTNAGPNSVDARVIFVEIAQGSNGGNGTIVQNLAGFAREEGSWASVFYLDNKAGRELLDQFTRNVRGGRGAVEKALVALDSVANLRSPESLPAQAAAEDLRSHPVVCLGGTFDHLHPGHKLLLSAAALLLRVPEPGQRPCRFIIGVTGDELLKNKKFAEYVQSWDDRARGVLEFLHSFIDHPTQLTPTFTSEESGQLIGIFKSGTVIVECVEIQDPFGPTITREVMDALIVSGETRSGGKAVNDKRREKGWGDLQIYEVDVLDARGLAGEDGSQTEDFGAKISSTAIREQKAAGAPTSGRL